MPAGVACVCDDDGLFDGFVTCSHHECKPKDILGELKSCIHRLIEMAIAFFCVTSVIVGLRLFQRLCLGSGLYPDDWLIIVSYICGIPSTVNLIVGLAGNGLGTDAWTVPFDKITTFLRIMYVNEILYFTQVFTVKLSILAFYLRLFPGTIVRRLIWGTIVVTGSFIIIYDLMVIFQCKSISHYWLGWDGESKGSCLSINALVWANAASSITLDVWMLALPLAQLRALQLHWKKKIGVALMFSVGVFVTAVSILRLQFLVKFGSSTNTTSDQFPTSYWSARWALNMEAVVGWARFNKRHISIFVATHTWRNGTPSQSMIAQIIGQGDDSVCKVPGIFFYARGIPVVVNRNIYTGLKVVNGAEYTAVDVVLDPNHPGYHLADDVTIHFGPPLGIILQSQETKTLAIPSLPAGTILIRPMSHTLDSTNSQASFLPARCTRRGLPVAPAFALTDYKAQGKTFAEVLLELRGNRVTNGEPSKCDFTSPYVQLSRCTTLQGIKLLSPVRLQDFIGNTLDHPMLDGMRRLKRLAAETRRAYGGRGREE
ncbi:CFEM domain-containing protein [Purpureocillium lavendulum]|uniref:CFEM domain-containing protein n=1 Tax=Purpureocillium lavendulum TaxID=1247861 RepID=A0AB34FC14_9HYPO|nr:CFEM domain-containing protein [Purpureocillium lavendulum]